MQNILSDCQKLLIIFRALLFHQCAKEKIVKMSCLPVSRPSWEWSRVQLSFAVRKLSWVSDQVGISVLFTKMCRPRPFPKPSSSSELCSGDKKGKHEQKRDASNYSFTVLRLKWFLIWTCRRLLSAICQFAFLMSMFDGSSFHLHIIIHRAQILYKNPRPRIQTIHTCQTRTQH